MIGLRSLSLLLFAMAVVPAAAQSTTPPAKPAPVGISPGEVTPTPEMWFYQEQMRNYLDPKMAVRQKAEFRASQRQARIASRQWFGFSNLRPVASSDNINGPYSPGWTSGSVYHPFRWSGGAPVVAIRPSIPVAIY